MIDQFGLEHLVDQGLPSLPPGEGKPASGDGEHQDRPRQNPAGAEGGEIGAAFQGSRGESSEAQEGFREDLWPAWPRPRRATPGPAAAGLPGTKDGAGGPR